MEVKILAFIASVVVCSFYQAHVAAVDTGIRQKRSTCGERLFSSRGQISSPNYPSYYPSSALCIWYIIVPQHSRVMLTFSDFQLESSTSCQFDYVEVRDGPDMTSNVLKKLCGQSMPQSITSTGNAITIKFRSDGSGVYKGFKAEFRRDLPCGGHLTSDQGNVTSPNYPQPYGENERCVWYISVPRNFQIMLRFRSFQLESSHACDADFLQVYDGPTENSASLGRFCGDSVITDIVSFRNSLTLVFWSDATSNYRGFSIQYSKVKLTGMVSTARRNIPAILMIGAIVYFAFYICK